MKRRQTGMGRCGCFSTSFLSASKTARALNKLLLERLLRYDSKEPFFGLPPCRHAAKFSSLSMRT